MHYGGLVKTKNGKQTMLGETSRYEHLSVVFINETDKKEGKTKEGDGKTANKSILHEVIGHFHLAVMGKPFNHGDHIVEKDGLLKPNGMPYEGTVDLYIEHIARESNDKGLHKRVFGTPQGR